MAMESNSAVGSDAVTATSLAALRMQLLSTEMEWVRKQLPGLAEILEAMRRAISGWEFTHADPNCRRPPGSGRHQEKCICWNHKSDTLLLHNPRWTRPENLKQTDWDSMDDMLAECRLQKGHPEPGDASWRDVLEALRGNAKDIRFRCALLFDEIKIILLLLLLLIRK